MQAEVNPSEDTEWNDILRQHGVLPPKPPSPTLELEQAFEEAVERAHANRLEGKSLDELDEIDDDGLEDEEFVQQYREKRIRELQAQAARNRFGEIVRISKPDYTREVTEASKHAPVVLHISSSGNTESRLLDALLQRAAPRFRDVKFVDIDSKQINESYPSSQTPTILVYKDGNPVDQLVTLATIGGKSTSPRDIDGYLIKQGIVSRTDGRLLENLGDEHSESD